MSTILLSVWFALVGCPAHQGLQTRRITIIAGGDVMLGREVRGETRSIGGTEPFADIRSRWLGADLVIVNLESPLCDPETQTIQGDSAHRLRASPDLASTLAASGIDVVVLANNHILDCGCEGLHETLTGLERVGIHSIGVRRCPIGLGEGNDADPFEPRVIDVEGVTVAILAATAWRNRGYPPAGSGNPIAYGEVADLDQELGSRIRELREQYNPDLVLVSLHWGREGYLMPSAEQVELAHTLIDGGADGILGHHPHLLQPVEICANRLVLYSMGNLVSDMHQPEALDSALFEMVFERAETGRWRLVELMAHPVRIRDDTGAPVSIPADRAGSVFESWLARSCQDFGTCFRAQRSTLPWISTLVFEPSAPCASGGDSSPRP